MSTPASADPAIVSAEDAAVASLASTPNRYAVEPLRYGPDPEQVVEIYGAAADPLLVFVHGGFFRPTIDRGHARPAAAALATARWHVWLPEYRRIPGDPDASVVDLRAVAELAAARTGQTGVWVGHSAGATLALLRACDSDLPPAWGVLALAGVLDLARADRENLGEGAIAQWVGARVDSDPAAYAALDPRQRVMSGALRTERIGLVHGSADATVPVAHSRDFPAPLELLSGAHHLDPVDPSSPFWPRVVATLSRVAGR